MRFLFLALGLTLAGSAASAGPISRCELADGRVVYSDEPCPSGARRTRTVDDKPPVEVLKGSTDEHAHDARASGSVHRGTAGEAAVSEQGHDREAASEMRKRKLAECDDLVRRIEYAQGDLNAAAEGERASSELSLRRLQAEHEAKCRSPH